MLVTNTSASASSRWATSSPRSVDRSRAMPRLPRLSSSNTGLTSRSPPSICWNPRDGVAGRRLDLDDVGAPVGEDPGGAGPATQTPSSTTRTPSRGPLTRGARRGRRRRCRREPHGHRLEAAHEVRRPVRQRVARGQLEVGQPGQHLAEHDPQLEAGERGAQAEVGAEAERQVRVRVAADVEHVGGRRTPPRRGWPTGRRASPGRPRAGAGPAARRRWSRCGPCSSPATPSAAAPRRPPAAASRSAPERPRTGRGARAGRASRR